MKLSKIYSVLILLCSVLLVKCIKKNEIIPIVPKKPPIAIVNTGEIIVLNGAPSASLLLDGRGSTNADSTTTGLSYKWKVISGQAQTIISSDTSALTRATASSQDRYNFMLIVTNKDNLSDSALVSYYIYYN